METAILIGILAFIVIGFFLMSRFRTNGNAVEEEHHDHSSSDGVCCGKHANCEKGYDSKNLYFDDEELDRFKGRAQEEYSDADIEEFRHVLYTMKESEVDQWVHCLQERGIEMPAVIKEEVLLMLQ